MAIDRKQSKPVRNTTALLLVLAAAVGLCSCKANERNEITTVVQNTEAVAAFEEAFGETTTLPEETTSPTEETTTHFVAETQPAAATKRLAATAKTTTGTPPKGENPEVAEVTGVETVKADGKTIVYPTAMKQAGKRWPVISWANGTGCPTWSYAKLLEALAAGGYIVVADDDVMTADGTTQIDSIYYILKLNSDPKSIFYQKVDTAALGVCGHSQGGRSCVNAAQADGRIRCVVSIAGSSYVDEARGLRTPCLFLTGTNDLIVLSSQWCEPAYDAVGGRAAYASLKGAVHTTCMTHPERVSGYVLNWFDAYLKNDAEAKKAFTDGGKLANDPAWRDFANKNG